MVETARVLRAIRTFLFCLLPMCVWFACDSTETGNPPVLDQQQIYWLRVDADAEIIGGPGAVRPGGSAIEVSVAGRVVARVDSNRNGSFQVTVSGGGESGFTLSAVNGRARTDALDSTAIEQRDSAPPSTEAQPTQPTDAAVTGADAASALDAATPTADASAMVPTGQQGSADAAVAVDSAVCVDLHTEVETRLTQALTAASTGCTRAEDCVLVSINSSCYQGCQSPVVRAKASDVSAALAQIEAQVCAPHNAMACTPGGAPCQLPTATLVCVQNECGLEGSGSPMVLDAGRN